MTASPAELLAADPDAAAAFLDRLDDGQAAALLADWSFHARPEQTTPAWLWRWWAIVTGRGFGKNRSAAEWVADRCEAFAAARAPHLIGIGSRSFGDARATQIGGESGLRAVCERRGHHLEHAPTSVEAELIVGYRTPSEHVSMIEVHTAMEPDRIRGRNFHSWWGDELAAWRQIVDDQGNTAFTNADLALRALCPAGMVPQGVYTTTPKPLALIKDLIAGVYGPTAVTRGTLFDNLANLAPAFVEAVLRRYAGTRLGAQEILGHIIDAVEGALWTLLGLEADRARGHVGRMGRIAVGVDPPAEQQAECGIIVVGRSDDRALGQVQHGYVLADYSVRGTPEEWAAEVVRAVNDFAARDGSGRRPQVVAEVNNGGDMVRAVIHNVDPSIEVVKVRASQAKRTRAEPVAMLADQHRWHHVGVFGELEEQQTTWVPGDPISPDRVDAMVWAATHLLPEITARISSAGSPVGRTGARPPRASVR